MKKLLVFSCLVVLFAPASAQISLVFPMERQVFQRDNSDHAIIQITGNFTAEYDSIQAQVTVRAGTTKGANTGWKTINYRNSTKPYFYGKLQAEGGWYTLDVRAFKNGVAIDTVSRSRVGIGEVFVIAGQSNASGTTSYVNNNIPYGLGFDTNEDRSIVMHYANKYNTYGTLPFGFSQMSAASVPSDTIFIGPFQIAPWCWGRVSEYLVAQLNVPVMLYGAAFGGTSVQWWKESANGEPLTNPSFFVQQQYNHPYGALGSVLRYYASLTGLRAVLWHQGEADHNMYGPTYEANLNSLIARSRDHSENASLAWVVARASWAGGPSASVITAQNNVINADANVFAGPETDNFFGYTYRSDNIHMDTDVGLSSHSDSWVSAITTNGVLTSGNPILASDFIEPSFACNPANSSTPISLNMGGTYANYAWSNRNNTDNEARGYASNYCCEYSVVPPPGYERLNWTYDSTNLITAPTGRYALNVRKAGSGKALFSPILDLNTFNLPTTPAATASAAQIRPGDSVTLTGNNCNASYVWNTNSQANPLVVSPASTTSYAVACKTVHCLSVSSAPVEVVVSSCFGTPLTLSGAIGSAQAPYESKQTIQSTQMVNSPGGDIDYTAAKSILLSPGFQAQNGTGFQATIQDCN